MAGSLQKIALHVIGRHALVGAGLGGALGATMGAASPLSRSDSRKSIGEQTKKRVWNAAKSGLGFGVAGAAYGMMSGMEQHKADTYKQHFRDFHQQYQRYHSHAGGGAGPSRRAKGMIDSLEEGLHAIGASSSAKTKKEVREAFRSASRKHHPDRGGDPEMQKKVNSAWEKVTESDWFRKLSFVSAFEKAALSRDEYKVLAGMGGLGALSGAITGGTHKMTLKQNADALVGQGKISRREADKVINSLPHSGVQAGKSALGVGAGTALGVAATMKHLRQGRVGPTVAGMMLGNIGGLVASTPTAFTHKGVRRLAEAHAEKERKRG